MSGRLLDIDDTAAAVEAVGAKALHLGRARRAGLPALPGVVVTTEAATSALRAGVDALARGGSGAARLTVGDAALDPGLAADLLVTGRRLGPALVVRSSSPQEVEVAWAGAFTSYLGVGPDELGVAVRGCWASVFSPPALARCDALELPVERVGMAVLIQPEVAPAAGGTARAGADGTVTVTAVRGSPAPLLAGWAPGVVCRVDTDGSVDHTDTSLPPELPARVAVLARAVLDALGHGLIEWVLHDDEIVLLQSQPLPEPPPPAARPALAVGLHVGICLRVARLVTRLPGPLAADLVLPWAVALPDALPTPPEVRAVPIGDPATMLAEVRAIARGLTLQAWRDPARAATALARLRGLAPGSTDPVASAREPDAAQGGRVLGLLAALADHLVAAGVLWAPSDVWRLSTAQLEALVAHPHPVARSHRLAPEPWGPFVHAVVSGAGRQATGTPSAPGAGAGVAQVIAAGSEGAQVRPGRVLVADRPLPSLAALLWKAAGLVTTGGGPGAHLLEVAQSLGVPAVTGCRVEGLLDGRTLLAVDGDLGTVAAVAA